MDKICPGCDGSGEMPNDHIPVIKCKDCKGSGTIPEDKIGESEKLYKEFLNSWQDITAPSGKEIHLNGFIEGCKFKDEEILQLTSRVAVAEGKVAELETEDKALKDYHKIDIRKINRSTKEIKKLRDALIQIQYYINIDDDEFDWDDCVSHIYATLKEALKENR